MTESKKTPLFLEYGTDMPKPPTHPLYADLKIVRHSSFAPLSLQQHTASRLHLNGRLLQVYKHPRQFIHHDVNASSTIKGTDLEEETRQMHLPGADVIDEFLAHPELFPKSWKALHGLNQVRFVFAIGTVYGGLSRDPRNPVVFEYVRGLYWDSKQHCLREVVNLLNRPWYDDIRILHSLGDLG